MFEIEVEAIQHNQEHGLPPPLVRMAFHAAGNNGTRNAPVHGNHVAAFFVHPDGAPPPRQVVIESRHGGLQKISIEHPNFDPMTYPIFFLMAILALRGIGNKLVQMLPDSEIE